MLTTLSNRFSFILSICCCNPGHFLFIYLFFLLSPRLLSCFWTERLPICFQTVADCRYWWVKLTRLLLGSRTRGPASRWSWRRPPILCGATSASLWPRWTGCRRERPTGPSLKAKRCCWSDLLLSTFAQWMQQRPKCLVHKNAHYYKC